jgi:hypothetical protein
MPQSVSSPALSYSKDSITNLYVDDLLIVGKKAALQQILENLGSRFQTKGEICGDAFAYLGLAVTRDRKNLQIFINQSGYLRKVLEKFDMLSSKGRATPMDSSLKPTARADDEEATDKALYRQAVGCILYAALGSRPDIAYAIGVLGRFASNPSVHHWVAIKHLLRYIKATLHYNLPLVHSEESCDSLCACADADHGGDTVASKSTSGYLIYATGILVQWKSKKQKLVSLSTMEAELVSICETWKTVQWISDVMQEIGHVLDHRPVIINDNQSGIGVLNSGNFNSDSRHMRLRYHHLVDVVKNRLLEVAYISTKKMKADGLTKALDGMKHREFVTMMGMG